VVISLGGSIVAPDAVDAAYISDFRDVIEQQLRADADLRLVIVVGGGALARSYQRAYRDVATEADDAAADWVGVAATHVNAELLRAVFAEWCNDPVVRNPEGELAFGGRILVAGGWKPGFSTDFDAVLLAIRFQADTVLNLSNIAKAYTADPKVDPTATPLDAATWSQFRRIVGDTWSPGKNTPFDPVASRKAAEEHLRVIIAAGRDVANLKAILEGRPFTGTVVGPD
jgi:uridylate kinase